MPTLRNLLVLASAAHAASGESETFPVGALNRVEVDIDVTAVTAGTWTFEYQRLGLDGVWYPVHAFTGATAAGKLSRSIGPGMETAKGVGTTGKLVWTLTGGPGSATFSASIVGK